MLNRYRILYDGSGKGRKDGMNAKEWIWGQKLTLWEINRVVGDWRVKRVQVPDSCQSSGIGKRLTRTVVSECPDMDEARK